MVNAFSFCIYGPENPKYHTGLIENIKLISIHFPDWKVYVYVSSDTNPLYVETLKTYANVVIRFTGIEGHRNSIYRFFAIDEPGVDCMFVRDADSRVHWKDRWAIASFMSSGRGVQIIRDHPHHKTHILAGLWGIRKNVLSMPIQTLYEAWTPVLGMSGSGDDPIGFGVDQNFLSLEIYPKVKSDMWIIFSNNCILLDEKGVEFPFEWTPSIFCGQVVVDTPNPFTGTLVNFLHKR